MTPTTALQALIAKQKYTVDCMDSWARDRGLPTYSELAAALSAPAQDAQAELLEALKVCHDALVRIRASGGHSTSAEIVAEQAIANAARTQPATPAGNWRPVGQSDVGKPYESLRGLVDEMQAGAKRLLPATPPAAPQAPDPEKVICPACVTQFRAIPTQVQGLLLAAGYEPPFLAGAQAAQPAGMVPLTDATELLDLLRSMEDFLDGPTAWSTHQEDGLRTSLRNARDKFSGITPAATKEQSNG